MLNSALHTSVQQIRFHHPLITPVKTAALVVVLVAAVALAAALHDLRLELVLLVAAEVRVGHEVERVGVAAGLGRDKVQLELGLLLQREPLDGEQRVGLGLADDDPPPLLALCAEKG